MTFASAIYKISQYYVLRVLKIFEKFAIIKRDFD